MTRKAKPAVVIGLGGTGQWVLTYVKKNLIDTFNVVPDTVQLLAFDTTSEETEATVEAEKREERAQVGNVMLDEAAEFVFLGGNIRQICRQIRDESKHPHIGSWLQAGYYLGAHEDDAYEISKGAGRRRPFGRMAVFYDLATGQPKITGKIEQAITNVKTAREQNVPIEIYVICSLAGGTGSGMFIDIAHLARVYAERAQVPFAVRGFLVLQNTFLPVTDISEVQPKTSAALRELDRFMLVFERDYPMYYSETKRELQTVYDSKLFDSCYLLDARRSRLPLDGEPPKLGVFPSVAECISTLLDSETGNTFDQLAKNVNEDLAHAQQELGKALYSSLGTYTYVLPVEDIIERNTFKLALELIQDRLLGITQDPATDALRVSSARMVEFKNLPRDEATGFLQMDKSPSNIPNLPFCQNVALALAEPLDRQDIVKAMADKGIDLLPWLTPVEKDEAIVQAGQRIQTILQTKLPVEVLTAKATREDYHTAADRIDRDIRAIRGRYLGREEAGGRRIAGEFQSGLIDYANRNRARFRRLLTEKLLLLLNGATDDPIVAKTGKLPYTEEFLQWIIKAWEEFEEFMRRVIDARAQDGRLAQARDYASQARQTMYDMVDDGGFLARLRGTAVKAEEAYIEAEDYLLDLERQDLLYQAVLNLATELRGIAQEARTQVNQWINILALGGPPDSGEVGVYTALLKGQTELKRRRDEQRRIKVYQYLTDDQVEDDLYAQRIDDRRMAEILRRFEWRLVGEDRFDLRFFYAIRRDRAEEQPELAKQPPPRQATATDFNVRLLMEHLRSYFYDIRTETIADRMADSLTAARAAKELLDASDAMISYTGFEQGKLQKHNFVCVNRSAQITYFDELADELKRSAPRDRDNQVIGLSNPHRCVIVSTADLLIGENTFPYDSARQAYRNHQGDRKLLHNFPAEVNASEYETRLTRPPLQEARRLLSPRLVALLEDREMPRRFVLALVYGLIHEEDVSAMSGPSEGQARKNQYVLRLDTASARQRREEPWRIRLTPPQDHPLLLDAMTNFVFVHLDPERGIRAIKDVTPETHILVEPIRMDKAIQIRESSIVSGREQAVEDFAGVLRSMSYELKPEGDFLLISAFRMFLADNEPALRRGEMDIVRERLATLVHDNRDCFDEKYKNELVAKFTDFIDAYQGDKIVAGGYDRLIRRLENYIDDKVQLLRGYREPDVQRGEKRPEDQLTRDLGSIMYIILWDEVQRLERLRDNR